MMEKVLVISPHPDDESIGCGGTIRKHVFEGDMVEVIFLTSGERAGHWRLREQTARIREREAQCAAKILGVSKIEFWRQPDGSMRITEDLIFRFQGKIKNFRPKWIYTPHDFEAHSDHKVSARLVSEALEKLNDGIVTPIVWMYEIWTPMQKVEHVVDISHYVDVKRRAIQAHQSQCAVLKYDEAILGLNRYRGEMHSWPGGDYAEIFRGMH